MDKERRNPRLSEQEISILAEQVAQRLLANDFAETVKQEIIEDIYQSTGESLLKRLWQLAVAGAVALMGYLGMKGWIH